MPRSRLKLVKTYLGPGLHSEVAAHAERHGLSFSAALRAAIEAGLPSLRELDEPERSQVGAARAACERAETLLNIIGPPVLGLPGLISFWAVRSDAVTVDEDELNAEFWRHARMLWDAGLERLASQDRRG